MKATEERWQRDRRKSIRLDKEPPVRSKGNKLCSSIPVGDSVA